eukprot:s3420_g12.t1
MLEEITKSAEKEFNIPKAAAVEETSSKKTDTGAFSLVEELGQKIVDVDDDQQLEQWKELVQNKCDTFLKFVVDRSDSFKDLAADLKGTILPTLEPYKPDDPPKNHGHVMLLMDTKVMGESNTQAHCRLPAFSEARMTRYVHAFLDARSRPEDTSGETWKDSCFLLRVRTGGECLAPTRYVHAFLDARSRPEDTPSRSWTVVARDRLSNSVSGKALTKVRHDYLMFYTEDGLGQRRERAGNASPRWPKEGKHVELVTGEALAVMDGGRKGIDRDILKSLSNSVSGKALTKVRHDYLMFYTEDGLGQRRERVRGMINQVLSNSVSGKALTKVRHDYLMFYTEDGLGQRRERVRGMINQVETLSIFTFNGMTMAKKNSKHFTGSNYGNVIGPLSTMAYDDKDCWILDPAGKKALYGPSGKTLAGGAVPDAPHRWKAESRPAGI